MSYVSSLAVLDMSFLKNVYTDSSPELEHWCAFHKPQYIKGGYKKVKKRRMRPRRTKVNLKKDTHG